MTQEALSFNDFITILGIITAGLFSYFMTVLQEKKSCQDLQNKLQNYYALDFYRNKIKDVLFHLDKILGKPSHSLYFIITNILFHYRLAIIYILIVFISVWVMGGSPMIGTMQILPHKEILIDRWLWTFQLLLYLFSLIFLHSQKNHKILNQKFHISSHLIKYIIPITSAILIAMSIYTLEIIEEENTSIIFLLGIMLLGTSTGLKIKPTSIMVGFITLVLVIAIIFIGVNISYEEKNIITNTTVQIIIFFIFIPFINAFLDFQSLIVSRYFFKFIVSGESWYKVIIHIFLDFILAILFFFILIGMLSHSIEQYINPYIGTSLQIPMESMILDTLHNPLHINNLWITFMLISTLIPTILHLIFALTTFLLYLTKTAAWYANLIEQSKEYQSLKMKTAFFMALPTAFILMSIGYIVYIFFIKFTQYMVI